MSNNLKPTELQQAEINVHALAIAGMLAHTDTEFRGDLLQKVVKYLQENSQFHTAMSIQQAVNFYG